MGQRALDFAFEVTSETPPTESEADGEDELTTTQEQIEAFHIIKAIVRTVAKADRVLMRDAKSYCAILLDDNNRKAIARLYFNRAKRDISLFSEKQEER